MGEAGDNPLGKLFFSDTADPEFRVKKEIQSYNPNPYSIHTLKRKKEVERFGRPKEENEIEGMKKEWNGG